jgi:hypothetical protein
MDGDRYNRALQKRYQKLYKQVGQAHFQPEELAHNALPPLMKDLRGYGDETIGLIGWAADEVKHLMGLPMMRELVDRDALKQEIEQQAQMIFADPRGKELAIDACSRYIDELDLSTPVTDVRQVMIAAYILDVYVANFESPAYSCPPQAKFGISHEVVRAQLPEIREHVERYASQIAKSVAKKLSLDRVSLPDSPRAGEAVGLDDMLIIS